MTRADFLANKKKNIEARGKVYNAQQWGDHFDLMDANRDGLLTAQEQADFDAAKKTTTVAKTPAPKAPAPVKTQAAKPASNATPAVAASKAPFEGNPATTVWFNQPGKGFEQSLVLGNGRIGAMVFGGVDEERIVLNEESVWSGSRGRERMCPVATHTCQRCVVCSLRRSYTEASAAEAKSLSYHGEKPVMGIRFRHLRAFSNTRQPAPEVLATARSVTNYRRELDLTTGLARVNYQRGETSFTREHFVSAPDEVFVSRLSGPVAFTVSMDRAERFVTTAVGDRELLMTGHAERWL